MPPRSIGPIACSSRAGSTTSSSRTSVRPRPACARQCRLTPGDDVLDGERHGPRLRQGRSSSPRHHAVNRDASGMTRIASAAATRATARAATRSAHHQPKSWSVEQPQQRKDSESSPHGTQHPIAHQGVGAQLSARCGTWPIPAERARRPKPRLRSSPGRSARVPSARSDPSREAMVSVTATRLRAPATTTEARTSARMPLVGSRRSTPKRGTATDGPGHIGKDVEPKAENPEAPGEESNGDGPQYHEQSPATEKQERSNALDKSRCLIGSA